MRAYQTKENSFERECRRIGLSSLDESIVGIIANIYSHVDYVSKIEISEVLDNLLTIKAYFDN